MREWCKVGVESVGVLGLLGTWIMMCLVYDFVVIYISLYYRVTAILDQ